MPPISWRHDLIATGVLSLMAERGFDIYPEAYLRRIEPEANKHPDGLIANREQGFSMWLEVENARKSGRNIDQLVVALAKASRGTPLTAFDVVQDAPIKLGLVAIVNRTGNRGGCLVKVKQDPQQALQVVDSNALQLLLAGRHRSIPAGAGG